MDKKEKEKQHKTFPHVTVQYVTKTSEIKSTFLPSKLAVLQSDSKNATV